MHRIFSVLEPERFAVAGFPFGVPFMRNSPEYRLLAVPLPESFRPQKAILRVLLLRRLEFPDLSCQLHPVNICFAYILCHFFKSVYRIF